MANSIDDILKNSSPEQQEKFKELSKGFDKAVGTAENQTTTPTRPDTITASTATPNHLPNTSIATTPEASPNAIDNVLSQKALAATKEAGQTLAQGGVKPEDKGMSH